MADVMQYQLVEEVVLNAGSITWADLQQKASQGNLGVTLVDGTGLATVLDARDIHLEPVRMEAIVDQKQIIDLTDVLFNHAQRVSLDLNPESLPAMKLEINAGSLVQGLRAAGISSDAQTISLKFKVRALYADEIMPYLMSQLGMANGISQLVDAQETIANLSKIGDQKMKQDGSHTSQDGVA